MKYDYGWHKLDGGKRWICHHCADHGYAPHTVYERPFEDWYETFVVPQRERARGLIKLKDPEYYNECYFYDDEESVNRYISQLGIDEDNYTHYFTPKTHNYLGKLSPNPPTPYQLCSLCINTLKTANYLTK